MKTFAVSALVLAAAACQPHEQPRARAERSVTVVTDAVLTRQSTGQAQEDALRTLLAGKWVCTGVASGIDISMKIDIQPQGVLQSALRLVSSQMDLSVDVAGRWVVNGFNLQQTYVSAGSLTGSLNGAAITPEASEGLKKGILELAPDPEAVSISDGKFTLTDGQGTVTSCTR